MISFDEFLKQDEADKYNMLLECNAIIQQKENIIKEVREYITGYESISILQSLDNIEENKDLDDKTITEMIRRYLIIHDKVLEILDKENK